MRHLILALLLALLAPIICSAQDPIRLSETINDATDITPYAFKHDDKVFLLTFHPNDTVSIYHIEHDSVTYITSLHARKSYQGRIQMYHINEWVYWHEEHDLFLLNVETYEYRRINMPVYSYASNIHATSDYKIYVNHQVISSKMRQYDILSDSLLQMDDVRVLYTSLIDGIVIGKYVDNVASTIYEGNDGSSIMLETKYIDVSYSDSKGHVFAWIQGSNLMKFDTRSMQIDTLFSDLTLSPSHQVFVNDNEIILWTSSGDIHLFPFNGSPFLYLTNSYHEPTRDIKFLNNRLYFIGYGDEFLFELNIESNELIVPGRQANIYQDADDRYFFLYDSCSIYDTKTQQFVNLVDQNYCFPLLYLEMEKGDLLFSKESKKIHLRRKLQLLSTDEEKLHVDDFVPELNAEFGIVADRFEKHGSNPYLFSDSIYRVSSTGVLPITSSSNTKLIHDVSQSSDACFEYIVVKDSLYQYMTDCEDNNHLVSEFSKNSILTSLSLYLFKVYKTDDRTLYFEIRLRNSDLGILKRLDLNTGSVTNLGPVDGGIENIIATEDYVLLHLNNSLIKVESDNRRVVLFENTSGSTLYNYQGQHLFITTNIIFDVTNPDNIIQLRDELFYLGHTMEIGGKLYIHLFGRTILVYDGSFREFPTPLNYDYRLTADSFNVFYNSDEFLALNYLDSSSFALPSSEVKNIYGMYVTASDTLLSAFGESLGLFELVDGQPRLKEEFTSSRNKDLIVKGTSLGGHHLYTFNGSYNYISKTGEEYKLRPKVPAEYFSPIASDSAFYFIGVHPTLGNQVYYLPISSDGTQEPIPLTGSPLIIYPNPASTHITIACPDCPTQPTRYEIISSDGQSVESGSIQDARVDVNHLPAGLYWLRAIGVTYPPSPFVKI